MAWMLHIYLLLVLAISMAEMKFCTTYKKASTSRYSISEFKPEDDEFSEDSSADAASKCFDEKASNIVCRNNGGCSGDKVCRTCDLEGDIACLINACQVDCGHSIRNSAIDCVKDCLSLDECNSTANAAFFINCVRNARGVGLWTGYKYWIIGIGVCCLVICWILFWIACAMLFCAPRKKSAPKTNNVVPQAAVNVVPQAAVNADPYQPMTPKATSSSKITSTV